MKACSTNYYCVKISLRLASTANHCITKHCFYLVSMYLGCQIWSLCLHLFKPFQQELHLSKGKESRNIRLSHCNKLLTLVLYLRKETKNNCPCHSGYAMMYNGCLGSFCEWGPIYEKLQATIISSTIHKLWEKCMVDVFLRDVTKLGIEHNSLHNKSIIQI